MNAPDLSILSARVIGRTTSLFAPDIETRHDELLRAVRGKRILAVGGAGSIGRSTILSVLKYTPASLCVVDTNENALADLVRDLRNFGIPEETEFRTLPIDFGSEIMKRFLLEQAPFDIVLNFAALKHVRSEKDVFSLLQMIDTNVVKQARFKAWLTARGGCSKYFAVSTDKAANPTSLMGASKRLMEDVIFDFAADSPTVVTSARFANVAFSNGSLLQAFLQRLQQRQPLAVPGDTRRYFVSLEESGHICTLAGILGRCNHVYFPDLIPEKALTRLETVAEVVLDAHGYRAVFVTDEYTAASELEALASNGQWPVIVTSLNTSGEKPYEEFLGRGEAVTHTDFETMQCLLHVPGSQSIDTVCQMLGAWVNDSKEAVTKAEIVDTISWAVPNLGHVETGKSLDDRV